MLSNAGKWKPTKRISKVLIPYAIWSLIYVAFSAYETPLQIPVIYLKRLILGNSAEMMYYIFVYCEFTLLIPLIDKLTRSRYRYWGFAIAPAEIIIMYLMPLLLGIELNKYVSAIRSVSCLGWFTYYYLGYMMGNNLIRINISTQKTAADVGGFYYPADCRRILVFVHGRVKLGKLPFYAKFVLYPMNAIVAIFVSAICVFFGRKILGAYSKYLAL